MLKHLLILAALTAGLALSAAEAKVPKTVRTDLKAENYQNQAEAEKLIRDRDRVVEKMQSERMRIIAGDAKARELRNKIMELHRELSLQVDSKPAMKELMRELKYIDSKLTGLQPRGKDSSSPDKD